MGKTARPRPAEKPAGDGEAIPSNGQASGQGRPLSVPQIVPWPDAVNGAHLLEKISAHVARYVVLNHNAADAVALWIVHTHAIDAANLSPRLAITSPEKRCGKTTLLHLLSALVARPLSASNVSMAILFRVIDRIYPTLLVDEADTFLVGKEEMRGIINAGHNRKGTALRNVRIGDDWEPGEFPVFCPMAIAAIGKLPGTIMDRSIEISLRRRRQNEVVERLRIDRLDQLAPLARQAARWAQDNGAALSEADPEVPAVLDDRAADNWRSLLAIADAAGGEWPTRARKAALAMAEARAKEGEDAPGPLLLADLRDLFAAKGEEVLFTHDILPALHSRDDRPWGEYQRGQPVTSRQFAALLKPLGIPTNQTVRRGEKTGKGYRAKDLADAWERYLPSPGSVTG